MVILGAVPPEFDDKLLHRSTPFNMGKFRLGMG